VEWPLTVDLAWISLWLKIWNSCLVHGFPHWNSPRRRCEILLEWSDIVQNRLRIQWNLVSVEHWRFVIHAQRLAIHQNILDADSKSLLVPLAKASGNSNFGQQ
jgi:hypothetical protein